MSNRDKLRSAIKVHADAALLDEIIERKAIWAEDPDLHEEGETFDDVDAFIDIDDRADDWQTRKRCRRILIDAGYYTPVTDAELARTVVSGGVRKYDFMLDCVKYRATDPLVMWLGR